MKGSVLSKTNIKSGHASKKSGGRASGWLDFFLWFLVSVLFMGGIGVTYYYSSLAAPLKLSGWIVLLLLAGGLALKTVKGQMVLDFGKKARVELRKVVWPTRQETMQVTAIVGVIVVVMSLVLWLIDSGLVWLASLATGQRG